MSVAAVLGQVKEAKQWIDLHQPPVTKYEGFCDALCAGLVLAPPCCGRCCCNCFLPLFMLVPYFIWLVSYCTLMHVLLVSAGARRMCVATVLHQVKEAKAWIDLHLAHLDYNSSSDLTIEQQSSCERLRRTATYILQVCVCDTALCRGTRQGARLRGARAPAHCRRVHVQSRVVWKEGCAAGLLRPKPTGWFLLGERGTRWVGRATGVSCCPWGAS